MKYQFPPTYIFVLTMVFLVHTGGLSLFGAETGFAKPKRSKPGFVSAVAKASPAVVSIQGEKKYEVADATRNTGRTATSNSGESVTHIGMGTGVIVDPRGYIVTNYHVVKGLQKIQITTQDGTIYRDVEFLRNDLKTDLALIKITPTHPLDMIRFGRSEDVELAEDVIAIGNPYGYQASVSRGIISGLNRPLKASDTLSYDDVIQTDTAINPGNSGGPLVNIDGDMIGLCAAVREGAENIAFAIPVDVVVEVVDQMIRQSVAKMTHHGLIFTSIDAGSSQFPAHLSQRESLLVESVAPQSCAEVAGIQPGDVIVRVNGIAIERPLDFTRSLIGVTVFEQIDFSVIRQGREEMIALAFDGKSRDQATSYANSNSVSRPITQTRTVIQTESETGVLAGTAVPSVALSTREDVVQQRFGLAIAPVSATQYKEQYPHLAIVALGKLRISPVGGVRVEGIDEESVLRAQEEKIEIGDLLFGISIGDTEENRLGITSVDDLYYIAQRWEEFRQPQGKTMTRIYLIRGETPYYLDIEIQ